MHAALVVLAEHVERLHEFALVTILRLKPYEDPTASPAWRAPDPSSLIPPTGRRRGIERPASSSPSS